MHSMWEHFSALTFDIRKIHLTIFVFLDPKINNAKFIISVYQSVFMTHRSFSVILSSHIGNLSQVRRNLHRLWTTDQCNWHRLHYVKIMLENGYLILFSKPNMVIHGYRPLCLNYKVIDKCIHTKCFWTGGLWWAQYLYFTKTLCAFYTR